VQYVILEHPHSRSASILCAAIISQTFPPPAKRRLTLQRHSQQRAIIDRHLVDGPTENVPNAQLFALADTRILRSGQLLTLVKAGFQTHIEP
jgi:hypothetical protein